MDAETGQLAPSYGLKCSVGGKGFQLDLGPATDGHLASWCPRGRECDLQGMSMMQKLHELLEEKAQAKEMIQAAVLRMQTENNRLDPAHHHRGVGVLVSEKQVKELEEHLRLRRFAAAHGPHYEPPREEVEAQGFFRNLPGFIQGLLSKPTTPPFTTDASTQVPTGAGPVLMVRMVEYGNVCADDEFHKLALAPLAAVKAELSRLVEPEEQNLDKNQALNSADELRAVAIAQLLILNNDREAVEQMHLQGQVFKPRGPDTPTKVLFLQSRIIDFYSRPAILH